MSKKYTIDQLRQVKGIGEKTIQRIIEQFDDSNYVSKYNPDIHIEPNTLVHGDMLEAMNGIPDKSVDLILTDLPYGTTEHGWDCKIPLRRLWQQYSRVITDNGVIVLFGIEPFSSKVRLSNVDLYKYDWVWSKGRPTGFGNANHQPMRKHENIMVFSKGGASTSSSNPMLYNPQGVKATYRRVTRNSRGAMGERSSQTYDYIGTKTGYPHTVLEFNSVHNTLHPTQKPVELLEYLIKTYTNENDIVLDSTMGSGSTCVAAVNTNRRYIGIELDQDYYNIAVERVEKAKG